MKKTLILLFCLLSALLLFASCDGSCHHLRMRTETFSPDCEHEGYILHTCTDCGYTYKSDFLAPLGHNLVGKVTPPSCTEVGYTSFVCSSCDYHYLTDYVIPTGHDFETTITPPTCTEAGYTEYACKICGYSYRADLTAAPGHSFQTTVVSPTCTEAGHTDYLCSVCAFSYQSDFVSAKGHNYLTTKTAPTLNEVGGLHHVCVTCGHSFESAPAYYNELLISTDASAYTYDKAAKGIDLSHNNGSVDFAKLRAAGIDFVILRAGFSNTGKDTRFEEYYAAATAAGLDVGCYVYTNSTSVAAIKQDVQKLLGYLKGKLFAYPVYLDMETTAQKELGAGKLTQMLRAFADGMLDAGYFPGIYTNPDWLTSVYADADPAFLLDVWIARHNPTLYQQNPNYYNGKYGMWQYCGSENTEDFETIPGVNGRVDIDICYRDYPTLLQKYGYNGY